MQAAYAKIQGAGGTALEDAKSKWLKPDLEKKLSEGFPLKVRSISTMEEYDEISHKVVVGFLHEDSQAKIMKTTVYFRAEVARSMFELYKDWGRVTRAIAEQLSNAQSRRTAQRWVMCGRDIDPEVMKHIQTKPEGKEFPLYLLESNPYLTGKETGTAAQGKKMTVDWQKVAIDGYFLQRDLGCKLSAEKFKKGYCAAAYHAAVWFNAKEKIYGSVAKSFTAFRRAKDKTRTPTGLEKVMKWMNDPDRNRKHYLGIPELEQLVTEMEKARAGANKQVEKEARDVEAQNSAGDTASKEKESAGDTASGGKLDEIWSPDMSDDEVKTDPVAAKAREYAEMDERSISIFDKDQESAFKEELDATFYASGHKALVYIECPTTNLAGIHHAITVAGRTAPPGSAVLIPCGGRTKIMEDVAESVCKKMKRTDAYWWTGSPGYQSKRVRQVCGVFSPHIDSVRSRVQTHVELKKVNAAHYEKIRLYCHNKACPWRCACTEEPPPDAKPDENAEIPMEDQVTMDADDVGDEGEEEVDHEAEVIAEGMSELGQQPGQDGGDSVRLFPSAHSVKWHEAVLNGIANART